ncbi:MAG: biotin transporter BioY [Fusobacterium sp.]|nr:biotin transporter BioY [Fusobacterium sp.]
MKRRIFKKNNDNIRFSLGTLVLILFCTFLLVVSTFVTFDVYYPVIPSAQDSVNGLTLASFFKSFQIIPQVPAVILVGALLGRRLGVTAVILYILTGLFILPVFALGGGIKYFAQYGFGYILAYIPAVIALGFMLKKGMNFKNISLGVLLAVLTIHLTGILYMIVIALIKGDGWNFIKGWIINQSGWKVVFDYILSFALVYFTKLLRPLLWCYKKPY